MEDGSQDECVEAGEEGYGARLVGAEERENVNQGAIPGVGPLVSCVHAKSGKKGKGNVRSIPTTRDAPCRETLLQIGPPESPLCVLIKFDLMSYESIAIFVLLNQSPTQIF